ncbi:unnamed protein product [Cercospora beticola]|nr:unnamed protein product [Cercospora beticola]
MVISGSSRLLREQKYAYAANSLVLVRAHPGIERSRLSSNCRAQSPSCFQSSGHRSTATQPGLLVIEGSQGCQSIVEWPGMAFAATPEHKNVAVTDLKKARRAY